MLQANNQWTQAIVHFISQHYDSWADDSLFLSRLELDSSNCLIITTDNQHFIFDICIDMIIIKEFATLSWTRVTYLQNTELKIQVLTPQQGKAINILDNTIMDELHHLDTDEVHCYMNIQMRNLQAKLKIQLSNFQKKLWVL